MGCKISATAQPKFLLNDDQDINELKISLKNVTYLDLSSKKHDSKFYMNFTNITRCMENIEILDINYINIPTEERRNFFRDRAEKLKRVKFAGGIFLLNPKTKRLTLDNCRADKTRMFIQQRYRLNSENQF